MYLKTTGHPLCVESKDKSSKEQKDQLAVERDLLAVERDPLAVEKDPSAVEKAVGDAVLERHDRQLNGFLPHVLVRRQPEMCNRSFLRHMQRTGTLANRRVFVGRSRLLSGQSPSRNSPKMVLGLFAGVAFKRGSIITEYGGILRSSKHVLVRSHARRVPGTDEVRDGLALALLLRSREAELEKVDGKNIDAQHVISPLLLAPLAKVLSHGGLGYMSNTAPRKLLNARVRNVNTLRGGLGGVAMFFVATRDIAEGEEIFTAYHNTESRSFRLHPSLSIL